MPGAFGAPGFCLRVRLFSHNRGHPSHGVPLGGSVLVYETVRQLVDHDSRGSERTVARGPGRR